MNQPQKQPDPKPVIQLGTAAPPPRRPTTYDYPSWSVPGHRMREEERRAEEFVRRLGKR